MRFSSSYRFLLFLLINPFCFFPYDMFTYRSSFAYALFQAIAAPEHQSSEPSRRFGLLRYETNHLEGIWTLSHERDSKKGGLANKHTT